MILIVDEEPVIWNQPMTKTQEKQKIKKKNQYYTLTLFKKMYGLWLIKIWVWAFWVEEGNLQATGFHSEGVQGLGKIIWADWSRKAIFVITEAANSNFEGILKGHVHADINHLIISFELQLHCLFICSSLYMAICGGPDPEAFLGLWTLFSRLPWLVYCHYRRSPRAPFSAYFCPKSLMMEPRRWTWIISSQSPLSM